MTQATECLNQQALEAALSRLPDWALRDRGIERQLVFADFSSAFGFMTRVALLCESQDHHPDWRNNWNHVLIHLSTHDSGGVTNKDVALATSIDQLLQSIK